MQVAGGRNALESATQLQQQRGMKAVSPKIKIILKRVREQINHTCMESPWTRQLLPAVDTPVASHSVHQNDRIMLSPLRRLVLPCRPMDFSSEGEGIVASFVQTSQFKHQLTSPAQFSSLEGYSQPLHP